MNNKWVRDLIMIPIIVGITLIVIQVVADKIIKEDKKLSIEIEGPFDFVTLNNLFDKADIKLSYKLGWDLKSEKSNEKFQPTELAKANPKAPMSPKISSVQMIVDADTIQIYRVTMKNAGTIPISNLPVSFIFDTDKDDFMILSLEHKTTPEHEFGTIDEDFKNHKKTRFIYSLLNPNDQDIVTLLINDKAELDVYAKSEGLSVAKSSIKENKQKNKYINILLVILSAFIALLLKQFIIARHRLNN
jgi:protein associated with RNAse G/E